MYSHDDISSVYSYLVSTPEGPLRKMLNDKNMSDTHIRLLAKLAKGAPESEFINCFESENFGSMRLSSAENVIRETFWSVTKSRLSSLGLLPDKFQKMAA